MYGLDDPPCFMRLYALVCEHHYNGSITWMSGENSVPILQSDTRYTMNSRILEIHNTSDVVDNSNKVKEQFFLCRITLPTGTFVIGNKYTLRPLGEDTEEFIHLYDL